MVEVQYVQVYISVESHPYIKEKNCVPLDKLNCLLICQHCYLLRKGVGGGEGGYTPVLLGSQNLACLKLTLSFLVHYCCLSLLSVSFVCILVCQGRRDIILEGPLARAAGFSRLGLGFKY